MRRGVSLLEVLIATLVLAVALLALMGSGSATHRHTHFLEEEVLAAMRAHSLLDLVSRLEFERLDRLARRRGAADGADLELDLDALVAPGSVPRVTGAGGAGVSEARARKVSGFEHRITYTPLGADRGLIRVRMTWDRWGHHRAWSRLIVRPEASFRLRRS